MTREQIISTAAKGHRDAVAFLTEIIEAAHLWDDLIDRDVTPTAQAVHASFTAALITLPRNPFYNQHFEVLNAVLLNAINNWHVANLLERAGDEADLRIAFITRSAYVDLVTMVAYLVGGLDWVLEFGPTIRRFAHGEGWDGYRRNLENERAARLRLLVGE